ncbi:MAG: CPBP family intramembrane metalloprotease [Chthonomonas sp.]|nr:CPBP family intramembrane metalloprotease [Chthonomonas sp.]
MTHSESLAIRAKQAGTLLNLQEEPVIEPVNPAVRSLSWATFWLMIVLMASSGLAMYLNPAATPTPELARELLQRKLQAEPLSPTAAATYQRDILTGPDALQPDRLALLGPVVADTGAEIPVKVRLSLPKKPLGIPKELYLRIFSPRTKPLKLTAQETQALTRLGGWGAVALRKAASGASPPVTVNPYAVLCVPLLFMILGAAALINYISNLHSRLKPRELPLPLAWKPESEREQLALVQRFVLVCLSFIAASFIGVFALPLVILAMSMPISGFNIPWKRIFGWGERNPLIWGPYSYLGAMPLLIIGVILSTLISQFLPGGSHELTDSLAKDPSGLALAFFSAVIMAPLIEEVLFRAILLPLFSNLFGRIRYGIIASSAIFAVVHMQGPPVWPVLFVLAATCSVAYVQSRSLWASIFVHMIHNSIILLVVVFG